MDHLVLAPHNTDYGLGRHALISVAKNQKFKCQNTLKLLPQAPPLRHDVKNQLFIDNQAVHQVPLHRLEPNHRPTSKNSIAVPKTLRNTQEQTSWRISCVNKCAMPTWVPITMSCVRSKRLSRLSLKRTEQRLHMTRCRESYCQAPGHLANAHVDCAFVPSQNDATPMQNEHDHDFTLRASRQSHRHI